MSRFHEKKFPGESEAYRQARDRLLQAELELRRKVGEVAALRQSLPLGGAVASDYVFEELDSASGRVVEVRLSRLIPEGKSTLLLYNFMYAPDWDKACPLCTSLADGWEGNAAYVAEHAGFALVAKAPIRKFVEWGRQRGWERLRLLSSEKNSFNADYNAEFESNYGSQHPVMHVFTRRDGRLHHFWSSEVLYCKLDSDPRHLDTTWPLWNLLDFTPEGRGGDWYPKYEK